MHEDRPNWRIWIQAARPKTLWAAVTPVLIGTATAYADGGFHAGVAGAALLGAVLIQIGTNLHNDYADYERGVDTGARRGPVRVTQTGLLAPETVRRATVITFAGAVLVGGYLVARGGWPIALIGAASVVSALWYTASPLSLSETGLADLFVLVFFGPVAVGGTHYVQTLSLPVEVPVIGLGPGLLATAILVVNNLRDVEEDRRAGRRTLAVRFGAAFARWEYALCMGGALAVPCLLVLLANERPGSLLALGAGIPAVPAVRGVWSRRDGGALNRLLARTGQILLLYGILFAIGWNL